MGILAIDPGSGQSGFVLLEGNKIKTSGVVCNSEMVKQIHILKPTQLAVEMVASYGMPVGQDIFNTCVWIGRFMENFSGETELIFRKQVLKHLGIKDSTGADSKIRQAMIKKFGEQGTKSKPGPTFGISSHAWSALAIATTALKL